MGFKWWELLIVESCKRNIQRGEMRPESALGASLGLQSGQRKGAGENLSRKEESRVPRRDLVLGEGDTQVRGGSEQPVGGGRERSLKELLEKAGGRGEWLGVDG